MVKRIEDLIKKWNYAELDNLLESDFPSELINLNTQKEIDELNPFDGTTMLSAQACFQGSILTYSHLRRLIALKTFIVDKTLALAYEVTNSKTYISTVLRRTN